MNEVWRLARAPLAGWPSDGDFAFAEEEMPTPGPDQMLSRTLYLSLDPYQWGRRRGGAEAVGDVCHGRTVSQVIESHIDGYAPGDYVFNTNGWRSHGLVGDGIDVFGYMFPRKLDPALAPVSTAVSQYGNADGRDAGEVWAATGKPFFDRQGVVVHRLFVRDFVASHQARFLSEMAAWIRDGRVKYREDIWDGLRQAPAAFAAMLAGGNFGKTLVRVGNDPTVGVQPTGRHGRDALRGR